MAFRAPGLNVLEFRKNWSDKFEKLKKVRVLTKNKSQKKAHNDKAKFFSAQDRVDWYGPDGPRDGAALT